MRRSLDCIPTGESGMKVPVKPLIILDLNGTILARLPIHHERQSFKASAYYRPASFSIRNTPCWLRPGWRTFARDLLKEYTVGVWSSCMDVNTVGMTVCAFSGLVRWDEEWVRRQPLLADCLVSFQSNKNPPRIPDDTDQKQSMKTMQSNSPNSSSSLDLLEQGMSQLVLEQEDDDGKTLPSIALIWSQEQCTAVPLRNLEKDESIKITRRYSRHPVFVKDLQKIWSKFPQFTPQNTLIIDDSEEKIPAKLRQSNLIKVEEFGLSKLSAKNPFDDRELLGLMDRIKERLETISEKNE